MTTFTIQNQPINELAKKLLEIFAVLPNDYTLKITVDEVKSKDEIFPEWEAKCLKPKFLKKIEQSHQDVKLGKVESFKSFGDFEKELNKIWND